MDTRRSILAGVMRKWMAILLLAGAIGCAGSPEKQVLGAWTYDTASMQIELEPARQKELETGGPPLAAQFEEGKKSLARMLGTITLVFKEDHTFTVQGSESDKSVGGKWSVDGRKVKAVPDKSGQPVLDLILTDDGRRMHTTFVQPGWGTAKMDLVK